MIGNQLELEDLKIELNHRQEEVINLKAVIKYPKVSQEAGILQFLQAGGTLTPMDALERFNCWALSSRISDLNKKGHNIKSRMETGENGKTFARYFIPR